MNADLDHRLTLALQEDIGRGDITTLATIPPGTTGRAIIRLKEHGVLSGLYATQRVFALLDPDVHVTWRIQEGAPLGANATIGEIHGPLRSILSGERLALNLLQRLSGVATSTWRHAQELSGTHARLLDTRKTTPLWRDLEKQAVLAGGGTNHRHGLDDGILIKDNHIVAAGSVTEAVRRARNAAYLLQIQCEVSTLSELREALQCGVDRLLLDNMNNDLLTQCVALRREMNSAVTLEASGNMTLPRLRSVAATGVDFISVGGLTHSAPSLDISLSVQQAQGATP